MQVWSQFAERVSGEWNGFGADFSNQGKPIELPQFVVPQAYQDWQVQLFDWHTQCPTLAHPHTHVLQYNSIQLYPTTGCDSATRYSTNERKVGGTGTNTGLAAFAYESSGSYVAVWKKKDNLLELEYCLVSPQNYQSRVRIIQLINVLDNAVAKMKLRIIRIFLEHWYGPFRNGDQIEACTILNSAFASTAPMAALEVTGIWLGSKAVATFDASNSEIVRELSDDKEQSSPSPRDGNSTVLLPKKLWCSLNRGERDETFLSEVGWLIDDEKAITSSCLISSSAILKASYRILFTIVFR
ncbi:hypothetical protein PIB30_038050 [Stylosanthes scabra]|uniref:Uncharacterized protein n=1 Tax=Stylosanthes scabra TaxID=79078 RepID=A0ABU6VD70_9FABA|nr:hypothetical protein [Stylosanthes scabra]